MIMATRKKKIVKRKVVRAASNNLAVLREGFSGRGVRAKGDETDEHAAYELVMFIENTSDLSPDGPRGQGRSVLLNALRKWRKGTYDQELAVKLFGHLAESGAKRYAKEFGEEREWSKMFTPATRREAARQLEESFRSSAENGEYDHVDTKRGARETMRESGVSSGGYSLRQSRNNALVYDAYFERSHIGSVSGPYSDSGRTVYKWNLEMANTRHRFNGRARTQTAAFNELIRAHKHLESHSEFARENRETELRERNDRPISLTYGTLPPFEEFERDIRRPNPDHPGQAYWPPGTLYPMELVTPPEIELAESFGLQEFEAERARTGRNSNVRGFQDNERAIYEFLEYLSERYENGDEVAGDLALVIMTTLGYEWI